MITVSMRQLQTTNNFLILVTTENWSFHSTSILKNKGTGLPNSCRYYFRRSTIFSCGHRHLRPMR